MNEVGLFVEDEGHRALLSPLIRRIALEESVVVNINERNATGGHAMVIRALRQYVRDLKAGVDNFLDILVVAIDGNCHGWSERRTQILSIVGQGYPGMVVVAAPDPHVERWYLADPCAVARSMGETAEADVPQKKCERGRYKAALRQAFVAFGIDPPLGGIESGDDIARVMNLKVACGLNDFRAFLDELRGGLQRMASGGEVQASPTHQP